MKYILEENIRHILSERFILTEADGEDTFDNTIFDKIKSLATKVYNYIKHHSESDAESANVETISELKTETFVLTNLIQKQKDVNMIKANVEKSVNKIEKILQLADQSFDVMGKPIPDEAKSKGVDAATVQDLFNSIKSLANSSAIDKKTINNLKFNISVFAAAIDNIATEVKHTSNTKNNDIATCEDLHDNLNKLAEFYTKNKKTGEAFILLNKQIDTTTKLSDTWTQKKTDDNLKKMLDGFFILNSNISQVLENEHFDNDVSKKGGFSQINWMKRYKQAADKNQFWTTYYKQVWGTNAGRIRALGPAFRAECEHYGFDPKLNPFISFIQRYIVGKNYVIDEKPYEVLHNAIARGNLKVADLTTTTNPVNIIYCKDFYNQTSNIMEDYIDLLRQIHLLNLTDIFKADFADGITEPDRKTAFINLISYFNKTDYTYPQIIWVILFDNITTANLLEKKSGSDSGVTLPDLTTFEGTKLRRIQEARALLAVLEPETAESAAKSFDDSSLKSLFDKIPTDTAENAGKWIVTMIVTFLLPKDAKGIYSQFPKLKEISVTGDQTIEIKKELFTLGNAMKKSQIENILVGLEGKNIKFREK